MSLILTINPGSTSTKIAVFSEETQVFSESILHTTEELTPYERATDQLDFRAELIERVLAQNGYLPDHFQMVVGRGGMLPPVNVGAYAVDSAMLDYLKRKDIIDHASNLGAMLAYAIAQRSDCPAMIYDSVSADQLDDIARIGGHPMFERVSVNHVLNARAMAMRLAKELGQSYETMNIIVCHLGGGCSIGLHKQGRLVDVLRDDDGTFSPERVGRVQARTLIKACMSGDYTMNDLSKLWSGKGGLVAHLGTSDARAIEGRIREGDQQAALVYEAMAYQIAKGVGEMATAVCGRVDAILITGGIAYSEMMTGWIRERVQFIAPVHVLAGEHEMVSLAMGGLRVLRNEEPMQYFQEKKPIT